MQLKRLSNLLIFCGVVILIGSIGGLIVVRCVVPEPEGSDPQKDQYLFGLVLTGLFGIVVTTSGGIGRFVRNRNPDNRQD